MRKSIWQRVKPWCVPLVLTLLIYIMLRSVFLIGYVPSASMEPTLHEGSFILGLRLYSEPKVGDIIIFEKDGVLLVKRIAACPGDSVDLSQLEYMMSTLQDSYVPYQNQKSKQKPDKPLYIQYQVLHFLILKHPFQNRRPLPDPNIHFY